jgi:2-hydroxychromene-2-carboxylate isomerase
MASREIDFWFTTGSTYTYLTVMRLPDIARASGLIFRWRPFHLGTLFDEAKYRPFPPGSPKTAYMWRDLERRASKHGIPTNLPVPYPLPDRLMANLVAFVGTREGWGIDYVRASYRRWFQQRLPNGAEPNLSQSLSEIGQEPARVIALARADDTRRALASETDIARSIGLFGSPSFVVEGEIFWGDDRLDDAVSWAQRGRVA